MIGRTLRWLNALINRREFERDLDEELAFHLEQRSLTLQAEGVETSEANRRARIEMGMTGMHRDAVRRVRGLWFVDALSQSIKLATRSLLRTRGFTAVAVTVLAMPLALGVLLHGLFSAYAFQLPAFERVERWIYLEGRTADARPLARFTDVEASMLVEDPPPQVDGVFSHRVVNEAINTDRDHRGVGEAVSENFFQLAGLPAASGRLWFGQNDSRDRDTLILSAQGAGKLFDGAANVIGRQVMIGDRSFTVIGVAGGGYSGLLPVGVLYWIRAQDRPASSGHAASDALMVELGGFLREGASVDAVSAALDTRAASISRDRYADQQLIGLHAVTRTGLLHESDRADVMFAGAPIALLVLLILLVAAANLANLVLARFSARRHDLALHAALGASRARLFSGMLVECLMLGLVAGLVAVLLVAVLMRPIHAAVFGLVSELGLDLLDLQLGPGSVLFAIALAMLASACFGALPAWWLTAPYSGDSGSDPDQSALKRAEPRGLRGGLMTLQLAASVFLVVLAGLVAANAKATRDARIGFDPGTMVAIEGVADGGRLARDLALNPNVTGVSATSSIPLADPLRVVSAVREIGTDQVRVRHVDAGWWTLLGMELKGGRRFNLTDESALTTAIVSERAAQLLWPDRSPLGQMMRLQGSDNDWEIDRQVEVVGIAEDYATGLLFGDAMRPVIYLPAQPGSADASVLILALRDASPPQLAALERACSRIDPDAWCRPWRMTDVLRMQQLPLTVASRLSTSLAWLALAISCVGLYGLVSYAVVQQRKSLGVRIALGATAGNVIRHVMRGAARPLVWGLAIGLALAWALGRLLAHLSDHLLTFSLDAFVLDPLLLALVALLACWLPARRSAQVPAVECLRAGR